MKHVSEITCCVVDYGTFICLAETLSKTVAKQYYYSPNEQEYRDIGDCIIGDGIRNVDRLDDFMEPSTLETIDLFVFPDIGYGGLQKYLRSIGKAVWGSMGKSDLELSRTKFLKWIQEAGLPITHYEKIIGISSLAEHLKNVENKWVKINTFRENMETWHHQDYDHSLRALDELAVAFGAVKEHIVFIVQDEIDTNIELGYDGWTVNGAFPPQSYQGYEKKNELYLGALREYEDMPESILTVNEAMSPMLQENQYRNFIATEIREKDGVPYFIDITPRMPGQTGEQLLETCDNLAEVMWRGANGDLIAPTFAHEFAAEATLHYTVKTENWKTLFVPEEVRQWVKLYQYCEIDGMYHFPPHANDEVGVVLGVGDTVDQAIGHLQDNLEQLSEEPVSANVDGFSDLVASINEAEAKGIEFSNRPMPEPAEVIEAKRYD